MSYLGRYLDNSAVGMTQEQYLKMCEMLGDEPDLDKMPPTFHDFPRYVHVAYEIFNSLPDNFTGGMDPIYCGKDYAALPVFYDLHDVADDRLLVFRTIKFIDDRVRKSAMESATKRANKK